MLAEQVHVGDHLWSKAGGWQKVKAVLRISPADMPKYKYPGKVRVTLVDGSRMSFGWHDVVHTATEYSTDA